MEAFLSEKKLFFFVFRKLALSLPQIFINHSNTLSKMKLLIACCGIDCENCDAYIATIANDDNLREETANKWRTMFNIPDVTADSINCMGCRTEGVKIGNCNDCAIRNCAQSKGFNTCGDCEELDTCEIIGQVIQNVPDAKDNLTC